MSVLSHFAKKCFSNKLFFVISAWLILFLVHYMMLHWKMKLDYSAGNGNESRLVVAFSFAKNILWALGEGVFFLGISLYLKRIKYLLIGFFSVYVLCLSILLGYFKYFGFLPYLEMFRYAGNVDEIGLQIFYQILDIYNVIHLVVGFFLIFFLWWYLSIVELFKNYKIWSSKKWCLFVLIFFLMNCATWYRADVRHYRYDRSYAGLHNGLDFLYLVNLKEILFLSKKEYVSFPGRINLKESHCKFDSNIRKNIIFLQVESLDDSAVALLRDQNFKPVLDESLKFRNFFAQHSGGGSSDAEIGTLLSLLPLQRHPSLRSADYSRIISLPKYLKNLGYGAYFYHSYTSNFFDRNYGYKNMGFDEINDIKDFQGSAKGWLSNDSAFLSQVLVKAKVLKQPFMAYAITLQSHGPFRNHSSESMNSLAARYRTDDLRGHYLASMIEVSGALKRFISEFKSSLLWQNTVVMIYGDHESGVFANGSLKDHVPLWVLGKDIRPSINNLPVSHLDLAPMALEFMGLPQPVNSTWLGSCPSDSNRKVLFNDGSVVYLKDGALVKKMEHGAGVQNAILFSQSLLE